MKKGQTIFVSALLAAIFVLGCTQAENWMSPLKKEEETVIVCAEVLVDQAYDLHEEAKVELARYFDTRDTNHLFAAYYAAADSSRVSRSVSKCPDRQQSDFFTLKNLINLNRSLQRVVRLNMRDDDPSDLIAIYGDQYDKVIPNDIE